MWTSGWPIVAATAAFAVCTAATVALLPPLQRRYRHADIARQIPLTAYLSFDLSIRLRSFLHGQGGVSSKLAKIADIEVLAPGVIRILGKNPGRMTLQGTNTYLLGHGPRRILIDASDGNSMYIDNLLRVCKTHGVTEITDLVITHSHADHIGGALHVKEAFPNVNMWKYMPPGGADRILRYSNAECEALLIQPLPLSKRFPIPETNAVLRTEYMPGHCADHTCFLLEDTVTSQVALFSGDCILGEGSCVFESLADLMNSLQRLRALAPAIIYPAHGPVVENAAAKIDEYITHRVQREQEIVAALQAATKPLTTKEIVGVIYDKLPFLLQLAAAKAVEKHLVKLIHENRVARSAPTSWLSSPAYRLVAT